jgi:hypothetical protein
MDTSRWPGGIWNAQDGRTLASEALDRLDYFIDELAKRGICVNINLHVGRAHSEYLGLPEANREYDKMVGIFTPALVEAQRQYARDLLGHVNPYRRVRYADDPAIAFVEITNEDSLFMWSAEETLRTLPAYYADILRGQFNLWLKQRYGSDDALRTAWTQGTQPLGDSLLTNGDFAAWTSTANRPRSWNLEQHEGCRVSLSAADGMMRVVVDKADDTNWHLQINQGELELTEGQYYTVSFEAVADAPRQVGCSVGQAHEPWNNLGFSRQVQLTGEAKRFSFGFVATADENNARLSFAFSGDSTPFNLACVELRPGGQVGLAQDETLSEGTITLYRDNESRPRILDRMMFLAHTEKAYFDGMRDFIRNDLGCQALVTGTVVFGPLGQYAQSDMDFIDSHAYWQHPRFPGRSWDASNWTIEQEPMTNHPYDMTLWELAAERLAGKPYTVSEYNHPAPLDAQAECMPMIASFAAAQDWDGIWFYTYSHSSDDWDRQHLNSYFDIDTNPAKWGFMRAGAAIFRPTIATRFASKQATGSSLAELAQLHLRHDRNMLGVLKETLNITQNDGASLIRLFSYAHDSGIAPRIEPELRLYLATDEPSQGFYGITTDLMKAFTGHPRQFECLDTEEIRIDSPEFVALTITPLDSEPSRLIDSRAILVTACGRCENTGMQFSEDRRTVGRNWGQAPVRIEPVAGRIVLPQGRWVCQALAPDGSPRQPVPISYENGRGLLKLSPQYATMWYLLCRGDEPFAQAHGQ